MAFGNVYVRPSGLLAELAAPSGYGRHCPLPAQRRWLRSIERPFRKACYQPAIAGVGTRTRVPKRAVNVATFEIVPLGLCTHSVLDRPETPRLARADWNRG